MSGRFFPVLYRNPPARQSPRLKAPSPVVQNPRVFLQRKTTADVSASPPIRGRGTAAGSGGRTFRGKRAFSLSGKPFLNWKSARLSQMRSPPSAGGGLLPYRKRPRAFRRRVTRSYRGRGTAAGQGGRTRRGERRFSFFMQKSPPLTQMRGRGENPSGLTRRRRRRPRRRRPRPRRCGAAPRRPPCRSAAAAGPCPARRRRSRRRTPRRWRPAPARRRRCRCS